MPLRALNVVPDDQARADIEFGLAFEIAIVSRRFRARFAERAKASGQTDSRWAALYMLHAAEGGVIQTELAERLGVKGPSLVRLLDGLEASRLISRRAVPGDRRAWRVHIEDAGLSVLREVDAVASGLRKETFAGISTPELQTALRVMAFAAERLERSTDG